MSVRTLAVWQQDRSTRQEARCLVLTRSRGYTAGVAERKKYVSKLLRVLYPDAWFHVLSEGASSPLIEIEEQLREKLQGYVIRDIKLGEGRSETPAEVDGEQNETVRVAPTGL